MSKTLSNMHFVAGPDGLSWIERDTGALRPWSRVPSSVEGARSKKASDPGRTEASEPFPEHKLEGWERERLKRIRTFVAEHSERLGLEKPPEVIVSDSHGATANLSAYTGNLELSRASLKSRAWYMRRVLLHEMTHAWQKEQKAFRWNFEDRLYLWPPRNVTPLTVLLPWNYAQTVAYALQPVELHAELTTGVRMALGAHPKLTWKDGAEAALGR